MALSDYDGIITSAADEWNLDPRYLKAILMQENGKGDPRAVSAAGAIGLGQLMPDTAVNLGVTDPTDPAQSIYGAAKYLDTALNTEGDPQRALLYYHGGPNWRMKFGRESAAYVPAVAAKYAALAPSAANNAMAKKSTGNDDPLKLLDPAPDAATTASPSNGKSALPSAVPADPLHMLDPAPAPAGTADTTQPVDTRPPVPPQGFNAVVDPLASDQFLTTGTGPAPSSPVFDRIMQAAKEGWHGTEPTLTPYGAKLVGPLGAGIADYLIDPIRGVANALSGAGLQSIYEAGSAVDPSLGRDLATMAMVAPAAAAVPEYAPAAAAARTAMQEGVARPTPNPLAAWMPPETYASSDIINPLDMSSIQGGWNARRGLAEEFAPRSEIPPEPAPAAQPEGPQAAGAQITPPAAVPPKTEVEINNDLQKDIRQAAEDRAGPQMRDDTVYVPGVQRTLAAREFSPANSLDEKLLIGDDPAFRDKVEKINRENNSIMKETLFDDAGDKGTLSKLYDARDELTPDAIKLFANEKPVDAQPLVTAIDQVLASPAGKRSAVVRVLNDVRSKLYDTDGNLETLPSQIYGARQNITDLLKKGATGSGDIASDARVAKSVLTDLLPVADNVISPGAPAYPEYLRNFSEASRPIDQQEYLQGLNLTGAGGTLQFSRVQTALNKILNDRSKSGVNKAKSLTQDQIQNLVNVRNELAANDLKDRLTAVKGSDTVQKLQRAATVQSGPIGQAAKGVADLAAEGTAGIMFGPPGQFAYRFGVKPILQTVTSNRAQTKAANALAARKSELLQTEPNPLAGP